VFPFIVPCGPGPSLHLLDVAGNRRHVRRRDAVVADEPPSRSDDPPPDPLAPPGASPSRGSLLCTLNSPTRPITSVTLLVGHRGVRLGPPRPLLATAPSVSPSPFLNRTPLVCRRPCGPGEPPSRMTPPPEDALQLPCPSHDQRSTNCPPLVELDRQHPFAAAAPGGRVLLDRGALCLPRRRATIKYCSLLHHVFRRQQPVSVLNRCPARQVARPSARSASW